MKRADILPRVMVALAAAVVITTSIGCRRSVGYHVGFLSVEGAGDQAISIYLVDRFELGSDPEAIPLAYDQRGDLFIHLDEAPLVRHEVEVGEWYVVAVAHDPEVTLIYRPKEVFVDYGQHVTVALDRNRPWRLESRSPR